MSGGFVPGVVVGGALVFVVARLFGTRSDSVDAASTLQRTESDLAKVCEQIDVLAGLVRSSRLQNLAGLATGGIDPLEHCTRTTRRHAAPELSNGSCNAANNTTDEIGRLGSYCIGARSGSITIERARSRAHAEVLARHEERNAARLQKERLEHTRLVMQLQGDNAMRLAEAQTQRLSESIPMLHVWLLIAFVGMLELWFVFHLAQMGLHQHFVTPQLIEETTVCFCSYMPRLPTALSRPWPVATLPASALTEGFEHFFEPSGNEEPRIVLSPDAQAGVRTLAFVIADATRRKLPLPNAVFYGPPGTGKTLTARRLAKTCDLDFAFMSGASVIGLGEKTVPELRRVFRWAARVRSRGLLLFIDEADAFLCARSGIHSAHGGTQDHYARAAVSLFLSRVGEPTKQVVVMLCTNRIEELDVAVVSRMMHPIEFSIPGPSEMRVLFENHMLCLNRILGQDGSHRFLTDAGNWAAPVQPWVAMHARGFTGQDVQALFDEFVRRWRLLEALGEPSTPVGTRRDTIDGSAWPRRWMNLREGRVQYGRRGPAVAAAAA